MKSKFKGMALVLVGAVVLTACGSGNGELYSIGDDKYDKDDYVEMLHGITYGEEVRGLFLENVAKTLVSDEDVEDRFNKEMEEAEKYFGDTENVSEEDKKELREWLKQEAGMIKIFEELGIITEEKVTEEYGEGLDEYVITSVMFDTNEDKIKDVKKVFKENEKDITKKIKELNKDLTVEESVVYNKYNLPYEMEDVLENGKGYVGEEEFEGFGIVYKIEEVREVKLEDIKEDIQVKIINENPIDTVELINKMDEEGIIKLTKQMREYLELDEDMVKGMDGEDPFEYDQEDVEEEAEEDVDEEVEEEEVEEGEEE